MMLPSRLGCPLSLKTPNMGNPGYKPSGVPWLGDVPEHWDVQRGKALFAPVDIRSATGNQELLTVSAQHGVIPRKSANVTMFKAESYVGYKLCWPGDLVINSLWAWAHGLGVSQHHGIVTHISHINPAGLAAISNGDTRCSRIAEHSGYHEC